MELNVRLLRALASAALLVGCFAAQAQIQAKAEAIRQLEQVYPGVRYTEASPNDWRISGVEFAGGTTVLESAQGFLDKFSANVFHVVPSDLTFAGQQDIMNGKFTAVYFDQMLGGLPVDGRTITILVKNTDGNPIVLVSGTLAGTPTGLGPTAFSPLGAALCAAEYSRQQVRIVSISHAIYTGTELPTNAFKVILDNDNLAFRYKHAIWVDATSGAIIGDRNMVLTDISGTLQGWATPGVLPDEASNPPVLMNLPEARVTDGDGHYAFTNLDGTFTIVHPGTTSIAVTGSCVNGKYITVTNSAGSNESESVTIVPPGPANIVLNPSKVGTVTSQVNALVCGTNIHDYVKSILPTYPGIDGPLNINVNVAATCNANYDYTNLNFYAAGGGCVNTCYSTVLYHEYGHFVIDKGWSGAAGDYHEGIADVNAMYYVNDPVVGRDFSGVGTYVRDNNAATYQYPYVAEVHAAGQVIAGAYWKAKRDLAVLIGDTAALNVMRPLYLNDNLLHPPGISPQILVDILTLDDDDGNLSTGTPHDQGIITGFAAHNLRVPGIPAVKFDVTLPPDFATPGVAHNATLNITAGVSAPNMSTVKLWTKVGAGAWTSTALGSTNPITVPFAAQATGTVLRWYISCDSATGTYTSYWPAGGQYNPQLTVYSYGPTVIFADDFETNKGWTVTNTAVSTGGWERGAPLATINDSTGELVQPGSGNPLEAGKKCYITQIGTEGQTYSQYDLDGGPTVLTSPAFDLSGGNGVVSFFTWLYSVNGTIDNLVAQISNDGGTTWTTLRTFAVGDYLPIGGNSYRQWLKTEFVVGDYVTPTANMKLRFSVSDNPNNSVTEAGVDTVQIVKFSTTPTTVTFNGHVDLDNFVGSPTLVTLHVQLRDPVTHAAIISTDLSPDASGNFSISNVTVGTYDIAVKGDRWLRVINTGVAVTGSGTTSFFLTPNGDATDDNAINLLDLSSVLADFGSSGTNPADLDGSNLIDLLDLSTILSNFGQTGPL